MNKIVKKLIVLGILVTMIVSNSISLYAINDKNAPTITETVAKKLVEPVLDYPLLDTSICLANDNYYMTGTEIDHNGINLWKSTNMENWEKVIESKIYDEENVVAANIHYINNKFYVPFSKEQGGTYLLKSENAKGPYELVGKITDTGKEPSMFQDDDGQVYWVYGEGYLAPMNDELTGLESEPELLLSAFEYDEKKVRKTLTDQADEIIASHPVGTNGASVFKLNGKFNLAVAEYFGRLGGADCYDVFIAVSDTIDGLYSKRYLAVPHAGHASFFEGKEGKLYCSMGVTDRDSFAPFVNKPGIVPLSINTISNTDIGMGQVGLASGVATETGAIGTLPQLKIPLEAVRGTTVAGSPTKPTIRDAQMIKVGDWYYVTGTTYHNNKGEVSDGIEVWKSKDKNTWEPAGKDSDSHVWYSKELDWVKEWIDDLPETINNTKNTNRKRIWAPELHYINGTFWITFSISNDGDKSFVGTGLLRSTSNKVEGPYVNAITDPDYVEKYNGRATDFGIDSSLFQDDNGDVYYVLQCATIAKMKLDDNGYMYGFEGEFKNITLPNGEKLGYEGSYLSKIENKYVLFGSNWFGENHQEYGWTFGTYDMTYAIADNPEGPYSVARVAVSHGGHSNIFKDDKDGKHYVCIFGSDNTAPFREKAGIAPLDIHWDSEELIIKPEGQGYTHSPIGAEKQLVPKSEGEEDVNNQPSNNKDDKKVTTEINNIKDNITEEQATDLLDNFSDKEILTEVKKQVIDKVVSKVKDFTDVEFIKSLTNMINSVGEIKVAKETTKDGVKANVSLDAFNKAIAELEQIKTNTLRTVEAKNKEVAKAMNENIAVELKVEGVSSKDNVAITIPSQVIKTINDKGLKLAVQLDDCIVKVTSNAVIPQSNTVELKINSTTIKELKVEDKYQPAGKVFEFTLIDNGKVVTQFEAK